MARVVAWWVAIFSTLVVQAPTNSFARQPLHRLSAGFVETAVVGKKDERREGSYASLRTRIGERARTYLNRALRVWFPHPRALIVTGAPVCFPDIVVTAAHVRVNMGDSTAHPRGLRVAVPNLDKPGQFREHIPSADFMFSGPTRRYDPERLPDVWDDFLILRLQHPVPADVVPLSLMPYAEVVSLSGWPPACASPTVNAAYHADLGLKGGKVAAVDDVARGGLRWGGLVPLVTFSDGVSPKALDATEYAEWYRDSRIAFPRHDTQVYASGSAVACPGSSGVDYFHGVMVGQMYQQAPRKHGLAEPNGSVGAPVNVATFNLPAMYQAIARLKNVPAEALHLRCGRVRVPQ